MYIWGANIEQSTYWRIKWVQSIYIFLDCKQQVDHHQTDLHIHININQEKNIVYDFTATTTATAALIFTENPTASERKKIVVKSGHIKFRHIDSRTGCCCYFFCLCVTCIDYFIRPSVRPSIRSFNINKRSAIFWYLNFNIWDSRVATIE